MQKWNLCEKLAKEYLDCKKSNLTKSQWSTLVKVNDQSQWQWRLTQQVNGWRRHDDISSWCGIDISRWRQRDVNRRLSTCRWRQLGVMCQMTSVHEGAWDVRWGLFFIDDVGRRKTIPTVMATTRSEQPLWHVRCMEEFCRNFDWRMVAYGWSNSDDSGGVL